MELFLTNYLAYLKKLMYFLDRKRAHTTFKNSRHSTFLYHQKGLLEVSQPKRVFYIVLIIYANPSIFYGLSHLTTYYLSKGRRFRELVIIK